MDNQLYDETFKQLESIWVWEPAQKKVWTDWLAGKSRDDLEEIIYVILQYFKGE